MKAMGKSLNPKTVENKDMFTGTKNQSSSIEDSRAKRVKRQRINHNHVGSSRFSREVAINQRAYKRKLDELTGNRSVITINDMIDKSTTDKLVGLHVRWYHTMCDHTVEVTPEQAHKLIMSGIGVVSIK